MRIHLFLYQVKLVFMIGFFCEKGSFDLGYSALLPSLSLYNIYGRRTRGKCEEREVKRAQDEDNKGQL